MQNLAQFKSRWAQAEIDEKIERELINHNALKFL